MDALTDFVIPIVGLKFGEYSYKFKVNGQFFKKFDNTDIQEGNLQIDLILKKRSNHMELMFRAKGIVHCQCDRCGGDLNLPIPNGIGSYFFLNDLNDNELSKTIQTFSTIYK